mgnify:CR=1 FL=1
MNVREALAWAEQESRVVPALASRPRAVEAKNREAMFALAAILRVFLEGMEDPAALRVAHRAAIQRRSYCR